MTATDPSQATSASPLRVGIAGLGIAARQVLPGFEQVAGVQLTAVADVRPEELARWRQRFGVETFTDVGEMCRRGPVDAVWVATPNNLHAEHAVLAADNGKHVICEKPMAVTLEQANEMVRASEANGVRYVQGHSKVYERPIQKMGAILASGELGRVIHINTMNYNDWLRRPYMPSEFDVGKGGGVVYRQGPHQLDVVRYLGGGLVRTVRATTGRWNPHFACEGNFAAFLEFEEGASATLTFNGYGHFDVTELTWGIGEGGRVHGDEELYGARPEPTEPISPEEKYRLPLYSLEAEIERGRERPGAQPFFGLIIVSCERGDVRQSPDGVYVYTAAGRREYPVEAHTGRIGDLQELVNCLREDRPSYCDQRWARATLEALLAVYQSSRERREVQLQHQVPLRRKE
ncbi:MAG TPA: Gfo/Idh/MocA family oxidoreductase [Chloroflexota bacterium]|jgi:phthalate 4,5-cis-dihydrodiol dehydrogenase